MHVGGGSERLKFYKQNFCFHSVAASKVDSCRHRYLDEKASVDDIRFGSESV